MKGIEGSGVSEFCDKKIVLNRTTQETLILVNFVTQRIVPNRTNNKL